MGDSKITLALVLDGRSWDEILGYETNAVQTQLVSFHSLAEALGSKKRARSEIKANDIHPEINEDGHRRCVALVDGVRCCTYSSGPLCLPHHIKLRPKAMSYGNFFKDKTIAEEFRRFRNDKHRQSLEPEQALLRTMLAQMLKRISDSKDLSLDMISQVSVMCKEISALSQKMSAINEVTPDQIELLLSKVVEVMAEFVPADRLEAANTKLQELTTIASQSDIPYEPDTQITIEGKAEIIRANLGDSINNKALIESLERLAAEELVNEQQD